MNMRDTLRGAVRRLAGAQAPQLSPPRRTLALPSILTGYGPRADVLPKPTPQNLRKFSETPLARKAINTIKDRIAGMRWRIQLKPGRSVGTVLGAEPCAKSSAMPGAGDLPDVATRIRILTDNFAAPNPDDSFRSFCEQVLEDVIVGGFGAIEVNATNDPASPLVLWPVDGASIRIKADWDGQPGSPRYAQAAGQFTADSTIMLNDDQLIYIRLNPRTHTPFGLGRLEVAFETINSFLSAHRYAGRLASNSVVQYALWLQGLTQANHERLIRWWQDEIEGTGRVPILSADQKPEVLRFGGGTDADLRLQWQEFLIRMVANAFDLPPQMLGVEKDVNRSTASEMGDQAFQAAIVPTARLFAESITRDAIQKKLGWNDVEFVFMDLDATNEMEQAQLDEILIRSGVLTVNEVRRARGLTDLPTTGVTATPLAP